MGRRKGGPIPALAMFYLIISIPLAAGLLLFGPNTLSINITAILSCVLGLLCLLVISYGD